MATSIMVGLDEALLARALRFVSPSDVERWVNQLVADRLSELERGEMAALMREGDIAREGESQDVHLDWRGIGVEGWPS